MFESITNGIDVEIKNPSSEEGTTKRIENPIVKNPFSLENRYYTHDSFQDEYKKNYFIFACATEPLTQDTGFTDIRSLPDGGIVGNKNECLIIWPTWGTDIMTIIKKKYNFSILRVLDSRLLLISHDGVPEVWDTKIGVQVPVNEYASERIKATSVPLGAVINSTMAGCGHTYSYSCKYVVTYMLNHEVKIWDEKLNLISTLKGHTDTVNMHTYLSSDRIATCSSDKTVKVWSLKTGICYTTFTGHIFAVVSIYTLRDNRIISSGSGNHDVRIWDLEFPKNTRNLEGHILDHQMMVDDNRIITSGDGGWYIWRQTQCMRIGWKGKCWFLLGKNRLLAQYSHTLAIWDLGKDGIQDNHTRKELPSSPIKRVFKLLNGKLLIFDHDYSSEKIRVFNPDTMSYESVCYFTTGEIKDVKMLEDGRFYILHNKGIDILH
jgi:WD40 repeat protein